ncbi:TIM barrel protein [Flavisolibacter sp. BT320]|nr:TIM barrel protein [Flavisolibacter longurius]
MNYQRRDFLKFTAALGAGLAFGPLTGCSATGKAQSTINNNFGLQLYTLRDDLPKDPKGVLTQIASFGYKELEGYEGPKGLFWGMSNTEFKSFLDGLGMKFVASHCNTRQDFERKAAEAAAIGVSYLIEPYLGAQKSLDDYKRAAERFNQLGEICKRNGLRFAYHNHDYSFKPMDGQLPQDVMMQATDKDLVDFEMDIYWVVNAGQDPEAWFRKYKDRFRLVHVKDRQRGVGETSQNVSVVLGTGSINFPQILKTGAENGVKHFMVEQEAYEGTTPLAAVKANADYMKAFRLA